MTSWEMLSDLSARLGDLAMNIFPELQLRHLLNLSQDDVQRRLEGINGEWFLTLTYTGGVAGTTCYDLPTNCKALRRVKVSRGLWTTNSTYESWARRFPIQDYPMTDRSKQWETSERDPAYLQIGDQIILEPTVVVTKNNGIEYYYTRRVGTLTLFSDAEESDIRQEHHSLIVLWAEIIARRGIGQDTTQLQGEYENAFAQMKQARDNTEVATR